MVDNPNELRYEAWVDEQLAGYIRYTLDGDVVTTVRHTWACVTGVGCRSPTWEAAMFQRLLRIIRTKLYFRKKS